MSTLPFLPQLEPGIFYPQQARRYEKNSATGEGGGYELLNIVAHHGWRMKKIFHF